MTLMANGDGCDRDVGDKRMRPIYDFDPAVGFAYDPGDRDPVFFALLDPATMITFPPIIDCDE